MTSHSKDWRETERRLSEMPDEKLRIALSEAGVKAVLPSHKKPRQSVKTPGRIGEATARWAKGDWEERISINIAELPDAQKFMADPSKPPTLAIQQSTPLPSQPAPGRTFHGLLWGLIGTAALSLIAVLALNDRALLDRPQITARSATAQASTSQTAERGAPAARTAESEAPSMATPAGSARTQQDPAARAQRVRSLTARAKRGDQAAMLDLARELIESGNAQGAMRWAGRAKRADRRSIEARIVLGDAQMLAGYGKAAENTWRGALARSPHNDELHRRLRE